MWGLFSDLHVNKTIIRECPKHGLTPFSISKARPKGKCKACAVDAVSRRRRKVKLMAIDYKGGKCERCGGTYHPSVYDFHHKDPNEKDFGIGHRGHCRSWDSIVKELDKCDMLCANCHRLTHHELEGE